jgi:hypothetical protein
MFLGHAGERHLQKKKYNFFAWYMVNFLVNSKPFPKILDSMPKNVTRDSLGNIATRYGLDGPGIEFRWG